LPDSFATSDAICESAESAAASVGPSTQSAAEEGVGFGPFIANELGKSFLGPFYPGYWTDNFGAKAWGDKFGDIWKDADNGWEITYALLDTTYTVIDNISNITGPLATVFGILGYMRYLPFPPLPAIGSFLTVASKILNGLNFILDIAKLVLSGLKLIVHGLVGMFADEATRKEFGDKLLGDVLSFAANGIAVGISAATDTSFRSGFSGARSQSKGILRSIGAGFKEQGKDALGDMAMAIRPNKFSEAYNEVFDEALEKAAVQRSITMTQELTQESDTVIAGVSGDGSGVVMSESVQAQSRLVASGTLTGGDALVATTGTSLRVVEETSEGLIHVVASDGTQLLIAKSQYTLFEEMVTIGGQELNREALKAMAQEIGGDVVKDGLLMVGGKLIEEPARSDSPANVAAKKEEESAGAGTPVDTSQLTADPAPPEPGQPPEDEASVAPLPAAAPVSIAEQLSPGEALMSEAPEAALIGPSVEAEVEQSAAAMREAFETCDTPLLDTPMPPESVLNAPQHLEAIAAQEQAMVENKADLEAQVVQAQGGQAEAKAIQEVATEHKGKAQAADEASGAMRERSAEDASANQEAKAQVDEGKAENEKGQSSFSEAQSETQSGGGGAPGDGDPGDLPWYKAWLKPIVRGVNSAKAEVTGAMTDIAMEAISGATGMDDMGGKLDEADAQVGKQQQVLDEEPAKFDQMEQVSQQEQVDADAAIAQAAADEQANIASEQAATEALTQVESEQEALASERAQVEADAAAYESTYGPAYERFEELNQAISEGDLTPMQCTLDEQVATIVDLVSQLEAAMDSHVADFEADAELQKSLLQDEVSGVAGASPEAIEGAEADLESVEAETATGLYEQDAQRRGRVQELSAEAQSLGGQAATQEMVDNMGLIQGRVVQEAHAFDEAAALEMQAMHDEFLRVYEEMRSAA